MKSAATNGNIALAPITTSRGCGTTSNRCPSTNLVDMIGYGHLFIGNVADIAIVAAAALIVLLGLRGTPLEGRPRATQDDAPPAEGSGR